MEIRLRPIAAALIVLALLGALGYFAWPRLAPLAVALGLGPAATATSSAPVAAPTGGPEITYLDESLGWDWQAVCAPQLRQFLAEKLPDHRINAVQISLVDYTPERKLPFGVRYPDAAGAQADANCYAMGGGSYTCAVGVARGEPGPDLDVAVTLTGSPARAVLEQCALVASQGRWPAAAHQAGTLIYYEPLRTRPTAAAIRAILAAGAAVYHAMSAAAVR